MRATSITARSSVADLAIAREPGASSASSVYGGGGSSKAGEDEAAGGDRTGHHILSVESMEERHGYDLLVMNSG